MEWYHTFNRVEAGLWWLISLWLVVRGPAQTVQQRGGLWLGAIAFVVFGATDLLEIGTDGQLPAWLWGLKIGCGTAILIARYTWRGWQTFRWSDREFLFVLACLLAVLVIITLQQYLP